MEVTEITQPAVVSSAGEWHSDPRLQSLGQRILLQAQDKPTSPEGEQETEGVQYKSWRIEHGVAEGDTEMPSGSSSLLSLNDVVPSGPLVFWFIVRTVTVTAFS